MKRLHLDWELQSMSPAIDGEYILYADHVEAMKRIAGEGAEPVAWLEGEESARHVGLQTMLRNGMMYSTRWHWDVAPQTSNPVWPIYAAPPAAPVAQGPVAWTLADTLSKRETTTRAYLWFTNPVNSAWVPLYADPAPGEVAELHACTRAAIHRAVDALLAVGLSADERTARQCQRDMDELRALLAAPAQGTQGEPSASKGGCVMKALSIRQPWAWLIVNGHKDIENRTWRTSFRGRVLIHASKGMTRQEYEDVQDYLYALCLNAQAFDGDGPIRLPSFEQLERGGIVGVATITDCQHFELGTSPWHMPDCWGFKLIDAKPLPFVPCKGALGFFGVPSDVAADLRAMSATPPAGER